VKVLARAARQSGCQSMELDWTWPSDRLAGSTCHALRGWASKLWCRLGSIFMKWYLG